jgi:RNA polymerase sigma-70 factor (ECF subfamily)
MQQRVACLAQQPAGSILPDWFERVTVPLLPFLYAAARVLTNDSAEAEELVVDTYARAHRSLRAYPSLYSMSAPSLKQWMLLMLIRTYDSSRSSRLVGPLEVVGEQTRSPSDRLGAYLQGVSIGTWTHALGAASCADVEAAFESLPAGFRLTLWLADGEGLAHHDIAEILGVSLETVSSAVGIARSVFWGRVLARGTRKLHGTSGRFLERTLLDA